ncbi:MAG: lytic transglycosylase domain-containing protein [Vulcanimicrobiaceae bacterium]
MTLAGVALAGLLSACAPSVSTDTMAAVVGVESGGDALALGDNTLRRAFHPRDRAAAVTLAQALIARGDSLDVGLAQVNSGNFAAYGVTAAQMLEPCRNVRVGSSILAGNYRSAAARFPNPRVALWHAIMAYNTGSIYAGDSYARLVVSQATLGPVVPSIALLTGRPVSLPLSATTVDRPTAPRAVRSVPAPDPGFGLSVSLTRSTSTPF